MSVLAAARNSRAVRFGVIAALVVVLLGGVYLVWPGRVGQKIIAYFPSAVGIYPSDDVMIVGVPVGTIESISPQPDAVKITMRVKHGIRIPADVRAVIMSPNIVAARFIQLSPAYTGGPTLKDGATLGLDRTAVPVEWDDVKEELTKFSEHLGPEQGQLQGPLTRFVDQAADTFDGNGDSFRDALRELSQTAGRLGDSRTDLFGTVKNLQILVDALSNSNEQIVQFSGHLASVSQVLANSSTDLDNTLGTLSQALGDVRGFLDENNQVLIDSVSRLTDFTQIMSDQSEDLEQILHVAPNGLANFYNIYDPAQGALTGLLSIPNFANPVQFICGGGYETARLPDYYTRTEVCRERMGPVMRRWAMNFPPILFHPMNSITAYKGQVVYDTPATEAKARTYIPYLEWIPADGHMPPRSGDPGDPSALLLPPNVGPGPPPPAQPQYPFGLVAPPPPEGQMHGPPPPPAPAPPGQFPAEGASHGQPGVGG